jgi:hypothetical protein
MANTIKPRITPKNPMVPARLGSQSRPSRLVALRVKTIHASRAVSARPSEVFSRPRASSSVDIRATSTSATRQRSVSRVSA